MLGFLFATDWCSLEDLPPIPDQSLSLKTLTERYLYVSDTGLDEMNLESIISGALMIHLMSDHSLIPSIIFGLGNISFGVPKAKKFLDISSVPLHYDHFNRWSGIDKLKFLAGLGRLSHATSWLNWIRKMPVACYQELLSTQPNSAEDASLILMAFGDFSINKAFPKGSNCQDYLDQLTRRTLHFDYKREATQTILLTLFGLAHIYFESPYTIYTWPPSLFSAIPEMLQFCLYPRDISDALNVCCMLYNEPPHQLLIYRTILELCKKLVEVQTSPRYAAFPKTPAGIVHETLRLLKLVASRVISDTDDLDSQGSERQRTEITLIRSTIDFIREALGEPLDPHKVCGKFKSIGDLSLGTASSMSSSSIAAGLAMSAHSVDLDDSSSFASAEGAVLFGGIKSEDVKKNTGDLVSVTKILA